MDTADSALPSGSSTSRSRSSSPSPSSSSSLSSLSMARSRAGSNAIIHSTPEEVSDKYQKLVAAYSKIKAQCTVLKRAVLDEQEKVTRLGVELKEKDIELRTSLQKIDFLTFHNDRLTKRVESMQQELDQSKSGAQGSWIGGISRKEVDKLRETMDVTSHELQEKIRENEMLHQKLADLTALHRETVQSLQTSVAQLEDERNFLQNQLKMGADAHSNRTNQLLSERDSLDAELRSLREALESTKSQLAAAESASSQAAATMRAEILRLQTIVQSKVWFDDTADSTLNAYNLPVFDRQHEDALAAFAREATKTAERITQLMNEYFAAYLKRVAALLESTTSDELSEVNTKLLFFLGEHENLLSQSRELANQYFDSLTLDQSEWEQKYARSSLTKRRPFVALLENLFNYLDKLTPYFVMSIREESADPQCSPATKKRNEVAESAFGHLNDILSKLISHAAILERGRSADDVPERVKQKILESMVHMQAQIKTFYIQLSSKLENDNRQANVRKSLVDANKALMQSLSSIVSYFAPIWPLVERYLVMQLSSDAAVVRGYKVHSAFEDLQTLRSKSRQYFSTAKLMQPEETKEVIQQETDSKSTQKSPEKDYEAELQAMIEENRQLVAEVQDLKVNLQETSDRFNALTSELQRKGQEISVQQESLALLRESLSESQAMAPKPEMVNVGTDVESLSTDTTPARTETAEISVNTDEDAASISHADEAVQTEAPEATEEKAAERQPIAVNADEIQTISVNTSLPDVLFAQPLSIGASSTSLLDEPMSPLTPVPADSILVATSSAPLTDPAYFGNGGSAASAPGSAKLDESLVVSWDDPAENIKSQPGSSADAFDVDQLLDFMGSKQTVSEPQADRETQNPLELSTETAIPLLAAKKEVNLDVPDAISKAPDGSLSENERRREILIKRHYETKIQNLMLQLQYTDSLAVRFHRAYTTLRDRQERLEAEQNQLRAERDAANRRVSEIKDKLATTENGYSTQLNLMTEHLCALNARIAEMEQELSGHRQTSSTAATSP